MAEQHRAMPWQWEAIERNHHRAEFSCLLELLHRVEALEATQHAHVDLSHLSDAEREKILKLIANPARFEVLEVAQQAHLIDPEKEKAALELMQAAGFAPRPTEPRPSEVAAIAEASNDAKPADSQPQPDYPAKPDSSPLCVRCWAAAAAAAHTRAKPNHPEILGTPLVDRVSFAICPDGQGTGFRAEARAAIREVAAWLLKNHGGQTATTDLLEQEAER